MFQLDDGQLVLAASDLTDFLACPHLIRQRLAIARSERGKPQPVDDPHAELIRNRGDRHETEQLARLSVECGEHQDLSEAELAITREALDTAAARTLDAMRHGAPLIYQAHLFDGRWQGRTDFLRRTPVPSDLGDYSYEVIDTKLARQIKPAFVHQLSLYSQLLARIQGLELKRALVILGDASEQSLDLTRYSALHRHTVRRLEQLVMAAPVQTYPEPVAHCGICALGAECYKRWVQDDHLSLVAGARREHRELLVATGITTVAELAAAPAERGNGGRIGRERFDVLRHQAALQVHSRDSGEPSHRHLEPERTAGYAALPGPDDGDVFFDLEGDPYIGDRGVEYLWGWWTAQAGYECLWAHDAEAEKAAFEGFVDKIGQLRGLHPDLHIYHYAPHERSKLRSLSIQYATREEEIDALLRAEVFVDLLSVVRRGLQVGEDSYSLKKLERHHGFVRHERSVREGGGSIVAYETWLETADDSLLESIRAYNEEDCTSTLALRDWLLGAMRPEAAAEFGVDFDELREPEPGDDHPPPEWLAAVEALIDGLTEGLSADAEEDDAIEAERRLVSHLLLYHRREGKPAWWRFFDLEDKTLPELYDDRDALAGLERDESRSPAPVARSLDYEFTFPPQEFRLSTGTVRDPTTSETFKLVAVKDDRVVLRRAARLDPPAPAALVPGQPIDVRPLREALIDLTDSVLADDGRFAAVRSLLRREPPALDSEALREDTGSLKRATLALNGSILPIQGPPGTGKTYNGARMVVAALAAGKRVAVTAPSHAAIHNLLSEIERVAEAERQVFPGICKGEYESVTGMVEATDSNKGVGEDHQLVAGTAWLFARAEHRDAFDLLFIDEAGQYSLADAAAAGLAANSVVMLGDPQQLRQVTQADHPGGSGASVLEHLLAGDATIPPSQGVLLTETWRMHPDVCAFVSERSYDDRLHSRDACALREIAAEEGALTGSGLRSLAVEHEGRSQMSPEEACAIAAACSDLLNGATVRDGTGTVRELEPSDIMVVAPYNLAVRAIQERVPAGVRVGTVDRFQGQEASVVFYAMTCSSGEDAPRGLDFLFNAHRLNVAVSRAQCLAVLVHSPRLLDANCPTLEAMELVDGACRFVEMST